MLPLLADENIMGQLVRGLRRRQSHIDLVRVQDVGLLGANDSAVLEWAAREGRILITQDVNTVPSAAYTRVRNGLPMPGVIVVPTDLQIGHAIEDILLLSESSQPEEWTGQILYLPI